jgi:periplasmic copper chaperone A
MRKIVAGLLWLAASLMMQPHAAIAHGCKVGALEIEHPWARALPAVSKNGAVYLEIQNTGDEPDRLVRASSPIAETAEVHATENDSGILRMHEQQGLLIAPNDSLIFQPGGLHIMLNGLRAPLNAGETFPLTLQFENVGSVELEIRIERTSGRQPGHTH